MTGISLWGQTVTIHYLLSVVLISEIDQFLRLYLTFHLPLPTSSLVPSHGRGDYSFENRCDGIDEIQFLQ